MLKNFITAFNGMCMAMADSVPGVSGGTVAFILGFYDQFINSLHDIFGADRVSRRRAAVYLLRLGAGWLPGMTICILLLSKLFEKNIYFMSSLFLGLTIASIPFIIVSEKSALVGKWKNILFTFTGAFIVTALSLLRSGSYSALSSIDFGNIEITGMLYLLLSGMIAITAMVLPGISGSSILLIAGVYLPALSLSSFSITGFTAGILILLALELIKKQCHVTCSRHRLT